MESIKPIVILSLFALSIFLSCTQTTPQVNEAADDEQSSTEMTYDSIAAKKYGADDYGMKKYVMAFLKKGPNRDLPEEEANALQMAHMENIGRMAEEGKLALAGPFFGDGDLRGIYIFNVESIVEAEALTNTDPAIKAGSLVMELHEWYGSAGVMAINEIHSTLSKKSVMEE
ncbi:MAG: YciI family protein [Bacteroidota bacterium]